MGGEGAFKDEQSGASTTWHICWQAAVGREFFPHERLYPMVRTRLIDAHAGHGRALLDFALLPGEMHVLSVLPRDGEPAHIARAVGNVVTRWIGQAQGLRSPVLAGPYRARRLHSVNDVRNDVRMLSWRAVKLGLCELPSRFPHGSYRMVRGQLAGDGFDTLPLLRLFGDTVGAARDEWQTCVSQRPSDSEWQEWELTRKLVLVTGSIGPIFACASEVRSPQAAALIAASASGDLDGALKLLTGWIANRLDAGVSRGLAEGSQPNAARVRALVARLATKYQLCSASAVGRFFGKSKSTISEQIAASRRNKADAQILRVPVGQIVSEARACREVKRSQEDRAKMLRLSSPFGFASALASEVQQPVLGSFPGSGSTAGTTKALADPLVLRVDGSTAHAGD